MKDLCRSCYHSWVAILPLPVVALLAVIAAPASLASASSAARTLTWAAKAAPSGSKARRRDPFVVPSRVKVEPKAEAKKEPKTLPVPAVESRLSEYRSLVRQAAATGGVAPDKLSPYLVEELTVTGIFRTSAGYGAFVMAEPTKLTFFVRPGMRTYDGAIKEVTPTGVRFVKNIRYDDGSVRQQLEFRALRSGK